jgi:aromatic-L-amino-acid decarboxylase
MLDRIKKLEAIARQLQPDEDQRRELTQAANAYVNTFIKGLAEAPAANFTEDNGIGLYDSPISEDPIDIEAALSLFDQNVIRQGINTSSGRFIAYIPGGGLYHSALGDYLAAATNRFSGLFFASPGAVRMENMLLRWMAGVVGYPEDCGATLTSGGSIANLTGIVCARDAHELKARDFKKAVIYMTEQTHHSVDKAIRIAGLRECVVRHVPLDDQYRMNADALEQAIKADQQAGLIPWLIVANAGSTDVGAVDPLPAIADLADQYGLWFHADGAYGAFFALCDEGKRALQGMERSDSITMDPHKGMFLPYGTGAALVRDRQVLLDTHYYTASYMQDAADANEECSPADLSPELTRHFRGLRLWLPLKLAGTRPFVAGIEEKMLLARYFHECLQAIDGFEVGPYPALSVATFRYIPPTGNANAFNQQLVHELQQDGRVFLSSTTLNGTFIIRLAVLSFRTHLEDIKQTIAALQEKVGKLLGSNDS